MVHFLAALNVAIEGRIHCIAGKNGRCGIFQEYQVIDQGLHETHHADTQLAGQLGVFMEHRAQLIAHFQACHRNGDIDGSGNLRELQRQQGGGLARRQHLYRKSPQGLNALDGQSRSQSGASSRSHTSQGIKIVAQGINSTGRKRGF